MRTIWMVGIFCLMLLTSVVQAGLVVDQTLTLDATGRNPAIAMKTTGPVIIYHQVPVGAETTEELWYTENLGTSWTNIADPVWGNAAAGDSDIAVDGSGNAHVLYTNVVVLSGGSPFYTAQTDGTNWSTPVNLETVRNYGVASTSRVGGRPELEINNDGVHIGWTPRWDGAGGQDYNNHFVYRVNSGSGWSAATLKQASGGWGEFAPQLIGSDDEAYLITLPRYRPSYYAGSIGPWYTQIGSATPNSLFDGVYKDNINTGGYANALSPEWNGSALNLALLMTEDHNTISGMVGLFLDTLGTPNQVVVYDDRPAPDQAGTAEGVALVVLDGLNYVFFTAEDPGAGTDTEVFLQMVNQNGTLNGSLLQLTNDALDQEQLEAVYGNSKFHLVYQTGGDGQAVDYMSLALVGALLGDANLDTVVSADDYASVQANFGNTGAAGGGLLGDANHDGLVSADDYASVQANFGNTSGGMSAVPEPVTMALLGLGGLLALVRRRR